MRLTSDAPQYYTSEPTQMVADGVNRVLDELNAVRTEHQNAKKAGDKKNQYKLSAKIKKLEEQQDILLRTYRSMPPPSLSFSFAITRLYNNIQSQIEESAAIKTRIIEKLKTNSAIMILSSNLYTMIEADKRMAIFSELLTILDNLYKTNELTKENVCEYFNQLLNREQRFMYSRVRNLATSGGSAAYSAIQDIETQTIARMLDDDYRDFLPWFYNLQKENRRGNVENDLEKFPVTYTEEK